MACTVADLVGADLDVLVIGGGIVGAGAALDAVTRGLRVALVEADDWGGGRSGHTGTLVHGGLVDLPRIGVGTVAALRRERDLLLDRTAPHLVRRVPMLLPFHRGLPERLAVGAGLSVYDAAAFSFRQPGVLPGHRQLTRRAVLRLAPSLAVTDITGAAQFYEGQVDDARLTITVVRTAADYGVLALSRTTVRRLLTADGRVVGAELTDTGGGSVAVRARSVVLATGTELSQLLPAAQPIPGTPPAPGVEPTLGSEPTPDSEPTGPIAESVHLVLPRSRLRSSTGLVLRSEGRVEARALYVVPWGRHWIVGSTAAWTDPDQLLAELGRHLARPIGPESVESAYASPAPMGPDMGRIPTIHLPVPGLVLVRGSSLAGYRADAERAVDAAVRQLGGLHPASVTRRVSLLGADGFRARWNQRHLLARQAGIPVLRMEHLLQRYGTEAAVLVSAIDERPELREPLAGAEDYLAAEVWYAVAYEGATRLSDVLARRTRITRETWDGGVQAAPEVARLMGAQLGWDADRRTTEIDGFVEQAIARRWRP